ncbi:hypothetical protein DPMN_029013 [Dreissena polymorpha]|uniref:Uncharacterized protein n=1 Tax=Dreissena polymorpha TaxID=45954 RepID=A0A9D4RGZ7_DREPO|nr:hypothetical protein DPMN_029013 [Dreissena polymorpha]
MATSFTGCRARWRSYYANFVRKSIYIRPYGDNRQRPMPDHFAAAIRSLPGDNTGHSMTGTSSGNSPVTGQYYRSLGAGPVTRPWYLSPVGGTGHQSPGPSGHRS